MLTTLIAVGLATLAVAVLRHLHDRRRRAEVLHARLARALQLPAVRPATLLFRPPCAA